MEGNRGGLKTEAYNEQGNSGHERERRIETSRKGISGHFTDVEDARCGVNDGHAVKQEGSGKGA